MQQGKIKDGEKVIEKRQIFEDKKTGLKTITEEKIHNDKTKKTVTEKKGDKIKKTESLSKTEADKFDMEWDQAANKINFGRPMGGGQGAIGYF